MTTKPETFDLSPSECEHTFAKMNLALNIKRDVCPDCGSDLCEKE